MGHRPWNYAGSLNLVALPLDRHHLTVNHASAVDAQLDILHVAVPSVTDEVWLAPNTSKH